MGSKRLHRSVGRVRSRATLVPERTGGYVQDAALRYRKDQLVVTAGHPEEPDAEESTNDTGWGGSYMAGRTASALEDHSFLLKEVTAAS